MEKDELNEDQLENFLGGAPREIALESYSNGEEDVIKEKVDLLWNQIMDPNTSEEERNQIIEELMDRIEEHEIKQTTGMSR